MPGFPSFSHPLRRGGSHETRSSLIRPVSGVPQVGLRPWGGESALSRVPPVPPLGPGKSQPRGAIRQILEGYVKNGVVRLLEGELPGGIFVKVIRES